jgi:hypothetical protein
MVACRIPTAFRKHTLLLTSVEKGESMFTDKASEAKAKKIEAEKATRLCAEPELEKQERQQKQTHLKADCHYFCAIADGTKRVYTDEDAWLPYTTSGILDPDCVSLVNLFINGMIQPPVLYEVAKGRLRLLTKEPPGKDVSIVLQFIAIAAS